MLRDGEIQLDVLRTLWEATPCIRRRLAYLEGLPIGDQPWIMDQLYQIASNEKDHDFTRVEATSLLLLNRDFERGFPLLEEVSRCNDASYLTQFFGALISVGGPAVRQMFSHLATVRSAVQYGAAAALASAGDGGVLPILHEALDAWEAEPSAFPLSSLFNSAVASLEDPHLRRRWEQFKQRNPARAGGKE